MSPRPSSGNKRKNTFGGSAGGGGYDYQAETYAYIAAKILGQEAINWADTGDSRIPVSVRLETGSGGDDLLISLREGNFIELQAKKGLRRGQELWNALIEIAWKMQSDHKSYGVLLTTTDASETIRSQLADGIRKIGLGSVDNLNEISRDFLKRLQDGGIDAASVCARIRIVAWDSAPHSQGESETLSILRHLIAKPELAEAARGVLVSDGLDLITNRAGRDAQNIAKVLSQANIFLSPTVDNPILLHEAYTSWVASVNDSITIPSLRVSLPISNAWMKLRAMSVDEERDIQLSLEEQIKNYHEWHRLAEIHHSSDSFSIETITNQRRFVVIVGGPGSGKSTLLRRLAYSWSKTGPLVLRVSLRRVFLQMSHGKMFDEALVAVGAEGFSHPTKQLYDLLQDATHLLADGLDETEPHRAEIADQVRRWLLANPKRHVVLTTRPIGHNPAWFEEWEHFELIPLATANIEAFSDSIFHRLRSTSSEAKDAAKCFQEALELSRTASVAARNPQMLGFLMALFVNRYDLRGSRLKLFAKIVEELSKQATRDREFIQAVNWPVARDGLYAIGWFLLQTPIVIEQELIDYLARLLRTELSTAPLLAEQYASQVLVFWEERGILERIQVGSVTTYTFIHLAFQEYAACEHVVKWPEEEYVAWVKSARHDSKLRETLLLTGATNRLDMTLGIILEHEDCHSPISMDALLAADVLAEAETLPQQLVEGVTYCLSLRLTSPIPIVAYEAGGKLMKLARINPSLVGSLALSLAQHEQRWTREVVSVLGLISGDQYVDEQALLSVFPVANISRMNVSTKRGYVSNVQIRYHDIEAALVIQGAKYLLRNVPSRDNLEIVLARYKNSKNSLLVQQELDDLLSNVLPSSEYEANRHQLFSSIGFDGLDQSRKFVQEMELALIRSARKAAEDLAADDIAMPADPEAKTLLQLWKILDVGGSPLSDIYKFSASRLEDAIAEVLRGVIIIASLDPAQVRADANAILEGWPQSRGDFFDARMELIDALIEPALNWELAQGQKLRPELLFQAAKHPSGIVSRFAALLLVNCVQRAIVQEGFKNVLKHGSGYALKITARIAQHIWGEEACQVILSGLEQKLTADAAPLVQKLGECSADVGDRIQHILAKALTMQDAKMVEAALDTASKLGLDSALKKAILASYQWWITEGVEDEPRGEITVIHPAPTGRLLTVLHELREISYEEVRQAATAKRSDVRDAAAKILSELLVDNKQYLSETIEAIANGQLPSAIIDTLSKNQPSLCRKHYDVLSQLLVAENENARSAFVQALGDGWAEQATTIPVLKALMNDHNIRVREEAVISLRRIITGSKELD
jgi:hypothetical protein